MELEDEYLLEAEQHDILESTSTSDGLGKRKRDEDDSDSDDSEQEESTEPLALVVRPSFMDTVI